MSKAEEVEELSDELFTLVQESQGHAFISDGEGGGMTRQQFFERVRGRLAWSVASCKLIRQFLKKYNEEIGFARHPATPAGKPEGSEG